MTAGWVIFAGGVFVVLATFLSAYTRILATLGLLIGLSMTLSAIIFMLGNPSPFSIPQEGLIFSAVEEPPTAIFLLIRGAGQNDLKYYRIPWTDRTGKDVEEAMRKQTNGPIHYKLGQGNDTPDHTETGNDPRGEMIFTPPALPNLPEK